MESCKTEPKGLEFSFYDWKLLTTYPLHLGAEYLRGNLVESKQNVDCNYTVPIDFSINQFDQSIYKSIHNAIFTKRLENYNKKI